MFETDEERTLLVLAIELRNIYSHNRGIVSKVTLKKLSGLKHDWNLREGKHFASQYEEITILSNNVLAVAQKIDATLAKKFAIKRKRYADYK